MEQQREPLGTGDKLFGSGPANEDFRDRLDYSRRNRIDHSEAAWAQGRGEGDKEKDKGDPPRGPKDPQGPPSDEPGTQDDEGPPPVTPPGPPPGVGHGGGGD